MNKFFKLTLLSIIFLISIYSAFAVIDLLSFEATLFDSSGDPINGNITIEIYDAASGGNLIYNSSNDFIDNVTSGKVDLILGGSTASQELNLTYGATYYMDLNVNGNDIDYNGIERQEFQSTVGNITQARLNLTDTLYTNALIPYANLSFDLGSAENYFRNAYIQTLTLVNTLDSGNISDVYLFNTGDTATGDYTFDSPTLHIDSGNNFVGIRTTTPGNALNVAGDGNFTGTLWVGGTQITADSNVSGGGTPNYLVKFLAETTIGNSLIYDDGTLVGIDTTSPQAKLQIDNSTALNVPWINVTDGANGIVFIIDNAQRVGIRTYPSEAFHVLGAGLFTGNLTVQGISDLGNIITDFINTTHILDRTLLSDDLADSSINSTLILDRDITADDLADSSINTTHIAANTILEEDLGISVLLRTDNVAFINKTEEVFQNNLTVEDSIITDYIFPQNETFTRIDNLTILQDLRVLGSSYLSSFTIGNDLLIGQSNISSTFVGFGTPSPIFPLHINFTDSGNNTITELLALERTNSSDAISNGYGSSILFRLQDDTGEVENVSQIAGILDNVGNGTERGALVFYTGYGDVNGIISNLSSAEAMRITSEGNVSIENNLAVKNAVEVTNNLTVIDSILADFIYPESTSNIALMAGNVGIGTTAPTAKLHIGDPTASNYESLFLTQGGFPTLGWNFTVDVSSGNLIVDRNGAWNLVLNPNGGNVGIGTTTPANKLHIAGGSGPSGGLNISNDYAQLILTDSDNGKTWFMHTFGNNDLAFQEDDSVTDSNARMVIKAGGKIGINSTNPIATVQIENVGSNGQNGLVDYGLAVIGSSQATIGTVTTADQSSNILIGHDPSNNGNITFYTFNYRPMLNEGEVLNLDYWNNVSFQPTIMTWDGRNQRVGIGTTAPTQLLNIYGNDVNISSAGNQGVMLNANGTISVGRTSQASVAYTLDLNQEIATSNAIHFTNPTTGTTGSDGFELGLSEPSMNVALYNFENSDIYFATNNIQRMTINGTTGNVGIGTTAPDSGGAGYTTLNINASGSSNVGELVLGGAFAGSIAFMDYDALTSSRFEYNSQFLWVAGVDLNPYTGTAILMTLNDTGDLVVTNNIYKLGGTLLDYVFDSYFLEKSKGKNQTSQIPPDYKMLTISELADFIEENRHLPGLPGSVYTGEQVEVGALPEKLLEKVEEQSIYIIQLQAQIDKLNKRISALEADK